MTAVISLSEQAGFVVDRLRQLADLPVGWDGEGGPALKATAKAAAINLVNRGFFDRVPRPHMGPVMGGGLQFEWQIGSRGLEIEVLPNGSIEFLAVQGDAQGQGQIMDDSMLDTLSAWLMQC
ncbi:MAG: hypothetical protein K8W52_28200 [Deltaproteobacteria bacterium]|nr:hypothetical protein [Deltaproteobacteria bacterium]